MEQHQEMYAGGPYQGYADDPNGYSDGEDDGLMMMEEGDYSMDAYGETGYLNQGYQQNQQYYGEDPEL